MLRRAGPGVVGARLAPRRAGRPGAAIGALVACTAPSVALPARGALPLGRNCARLNVGAVGATGGTVVHGHPALAAQASGPPSRPAVTLVGAPPVTTRLASGAALGGRPLAASGTCAGGAPLAVEALRPAAPAAATLPPVAAAVQLSLGFRPGVPGALGRALLLATARAKAAVGLGEVTSRTSYTSPARRVRRSAFCYGAARRRGCRLGPYEACGDPPRRSWRRRSGGAPGSDAPPNAITGACRRQTTPSRPPPTSAHRNPSG